MYYYYYGYRQNKATKFITVYINDDAQKKIDSQQNDKDTKRGYYEY